MKLRTNPKRTEKALDSTSKPGGRASISTPVQPSKVTKTPSKPAATETPKTGVGPGPVPVTGPRPRGRPRLSALPAAAPAKTPTPSTPAAKSQPSSQTQSRAKSKADAASEEDDEKVVIKTEADASPTKGSTKGDTPMDVDVDTDAKKKKDNSIGGTTGTTTVATATTATATPSTVTVASKIKATPSPASSPSPSGASAQTVTVTKTSAKTPPTSTPSSATTTTPAPVLKFAASSAESTRSKAAIAGAKLTPAGTTKASSAEAEKVKTKVSAPSPASEYTKASTKTKDEPVPAPVSAASAKSIQSQPKVLRGASQPKVITSGTPTATASVSSSTATPGATPIPSTKSDESDKKKSTISEVEVKTVAPTPTVAVTALASASASSKSNESEKEKDKSISDDAPKVTSAKAVTSKTAVSKAATTTTATSALTDTITQKELDEAQECAATEKIPAEPLVVVTGASPILKDSKQLVLKLDKLAASETQTPVQLPKRSERTSTILKRKLSEDAPPRPGTGKRGRPPTKNKVQPAASAPTASAAATKEADAKSSSQDKDKDVDMDNPKDKEREKDERSFERFYSKIKDTSVVSERWSFGGVLWDPTKKMKVMAASEVDVTCNGNMRLRRCVQVFENMTVRVMVEGAEMTSTFSTTGKVSNANEVTQLIHKVATSKICTGIKNFGTTDKIYFPHCVLRGESYFAPECPIVIDYGVVGPLCQHCNRLRNMIQRRNIKETNLLYSKFSRAPVKNIRSGFGKQLYSMLTDLVETSSVDAKKERKKLRRMIPSNAKEYPFRSDLSKMHPNMLEGLTMDDHQMQMQQQQIQLQLAQQQLQMHQHQQLQQFIKSDASGNITISSIPGNTIVTPVTGSSDYIRLAKPFMGQNTSEMMTFNVLPGQRGSYKVARDSSGQLTAVSTAGGTYTNLSSGAVLTPSEMQMVEQLVLQEGHDVGNVIIQNSGDFTLAEGQEYELIGEADSDNPIQVLEVLKEENQSNNTIEIIEVDDQTLAQLTSQNLGNFIIQEPSSGFEVQEIDANDPNFRHLVKALNPGGTVVYQT